MLLLLMSAIAVTPFGCTRRPQVSAFRIVDYLASGETTRYRESFSEAWYTLDSHGNVDLVLRRTGGETGSGQPLTQLVHIHSVWRPVPGRTITGRTQINGTVTYYLLSGRVGTAYDGAGSVFFTKNKDGKLYGTLEWAIVSPTRRLGAESPLFTRAELTGEFVAESDPRRVIQLTNEMNRLFGPAPANRATALSSR